MVSRAAAGAGAALLFASAGCVHPFDQDAYVQQQFHTLQATEESSYQATYSKTEATEADFVSALSTDGDAVKASPRYASLVARNQPVSDRVKRNLARHEDLLKWAQGLPKPTQDDYQRLAADYQTLIAELNQANMTIYKLSSDHTNIVREADMRRGM